MHLADKAELQNGLVKKVPTGVTKEKPVDSEPVVDGGALLQHLPWPKSTSYADICQLYIQHVHKYYYNALIVCDGYEGGPTTKDETHQRRTGNEMGVEVDFTLDMLLRMKKSFLANQKNKQTFFNLLTIQMKKEGDIQVENSIDDADFDIVMFAC